MNTLIKKDEFKVVMTSLQIGTITGKAHKNVIRDIEDEISKLGEEIGKLIFELTYYVDKSNRRSKMYNINKDGAMQLGARYDAKVRYKMIQKINQLEEESLPKIPKTYAEALLEAGRMAKEVERLEAEVEVKNQIIQEYEPKVDYVDLILLSTGTMTITQIASDYDITAQQLNSILYDQKIQRKVNGQWILFKEQMNKGYTKTNTFFDKKGSVVIKSNWTQKGRLKIHEILTGLDIKPIMDKD